MGIGAAWHRQQTKNDYLTRKAPYRFESAFLHRRICKPSAPRERTRSFQKRRAEQNWSRRHSASSLLETVEPLNGFVVRAALGHQRCATVMWEQVGFFRGKPRGSYI
jgi:hypothetical protein